MWVGRGDHVKVKIRRMQEYGSLFDMGRHALNVIPIGDLPCQNLLEFNPISRGYQVQFEHPNGRLYQGDSLDWLESIDDSTIDLVFADPPYNIKKADWDNFESQEAYIIWSMQWIEQAARILKNSGSLYICGFSEILADLKHPASKYFKSCRWIIWHYKNKANLGNDWGT